MPLEAETHAVRTGMAMPPLAETAFRRSGICTYPVLGAPDVAPLYKYILPSILRQHLGNIPLVVNSGEEANEERTDEPYPVKAMLSHTSSHDQSPSSHSHQQPSMNR